MDVYFCLQIIQLLPDSKRAYNMNIALSKFNNYSYQELREAIIDLNPKVRRSVFFLCVHSLLRLYSIPDIELRLVQEGPAQCKIALSP